jgi:hypothetical protein
VQFLLFPSQADGRASRGFLRRKVASSAEAVSFQDLPLICSAAV